MRVLLDYEEFLMTIRVNKIREGVRRVNKIKSRLFELKRNSCKGD